MDPQARFCHNPDCPARGQPGLGNIRIHSRAERRYRCTACGRTFAETRGTPFYRLKKATDLVTIVLTLLCHGCPLQAIVATFGLDERTVAAWRQRAGRHGQDFHEHHVLSGRVELGHVQADELYVKAVARRLWMAMAMAVPSRLWLGGVISPRRDLALDHGRGADGSRRGPKPGHPGLRRWPGQLRDGLHAGLPRPGVDRPPGPATAGAHGRASARAGDQAPRRAVPHRRDPPGRARD